MRFGSAQLVLGAPNPLLARTGLHIEQFAGREYCVLRRFIKWTQDAFKAGGSKSELLPLLERCTRELQGVERYRDDARYLRVWIQYVGPSKAALLALSH